MVDFWQETKISLNIHHFYYSPFTFLTHFQTFSRSNYPQYFPLEFLQKLWLTQVWYDREPEWQFQCQFFSHNRNLLSSACNWVDGRLDKERDPVQSTPLFHLVRLHAGPLLCDRLCTLGWTLLSQVSEEESVLSIFNHHTLLTTA